MSLESTFSVIQYIFVYVVSEAGHSKVYFRISDGALLHLLKDGLNLSILEICLFNRVFLGLDDI